MSATKIRCHPLAVAMNAIGYRLDDVRASLDSYRQDRDRYPDLFAKPEFQAQYEALLAQAAELTDALEHLEQLRLEALTDTLSAHH